MIQKPFKVFYLLFLGLVFSCSKQVKPSTFYSPNYKDGGVERHDGLGFEIPKKYTIDVIYFTEQPKQSFELIENLSISDESPLAENQTVNGKMLNRGNHQTKKQEILDRMVAQAIDLGASALIDVKYQVYSTKDASGFTFSGKAIRYVLK